MQIFDDPFQAGRAAHRILDWVVIHGRTWVVTRCYDWHPATARELRHLHRQR